MDSKLVRRGVLFTVLAVALVFVIVYLANADRFRRTGASTGAAASTAATEEALPEDPRGLRIGDNLKAFLGDPDFFDPVSLPSDVIEEEEVITVTPRFTVEGNQVTVRVVDSADRLVTGQAFSVRAYQAEGTVHRAEMIYTDSDMDGVIRIEELPGGEWDLSMRPILGFRIPTEETRISIEKEETEEEEDAGTSDTAADTETEETTDSAEETPEDASTGATGDEDTETTETEERDGTN